MKKIILVSILLLALLALGSIVAYKTYIKPIKLTTTSVSLSPSPQSVFNSIKDAMSKSLTLTCEYTDANQKQAKVYIKAGAVRADSQNSTTSGEIDSVIMKDNKLYVWNNQQQQGTVIDFSSKTNTSTDSGAKVNPNASQKATTFLADIEAQKNNCKPGVVSDTMFTLPTNVTFLNLADMMNAQTTGIPVNLQQYMQKLTPPSGN